MELSGLRDTDRLILAAMDDRSLLEMMKTNKKFFREGELAFEKRMKQRYPELAKKKEDGERWSQFYLQNVYFLNKLKEEFNIDYVPVPFFNPEALYRVRKLDNTYNYDTNIYLSQCYAELGDKTKLLHFYNNLDIGEIELDDGYDIEEAQSDLQPIIFQCLLKYKHLGLFNDLKKLWDKNASIIYGVDYVVQNRDVNFVDSVIKEILDENKDHDIMDNLFYTGIGGAAEIADMKMIKHLEKKFKKKAPLENILTSAIDGCQIAFIKSLIVVDPKSDMYNKYNLSSLLATSLTTYLIGESDDFLSQKDAYKIVKFVVDLLKSLGNSKGKILELMDVSEYVDDAEEFFETFHDPLLATYVKELLF